MGKDSFDGKILDFEGKSWRMLKSNLEKAIDPEKSRLAITKNSVKVHLAKIKGEFGYDAWMDLQDKKAGRPKADKENPTAGLMDMMKDMYDDGDDQMKKTIGEAMMKAQRGERHEPTDDF